MQAPSIRANSRSALKSVIKEVVGSDGEIVLFIDEIHTLVGAGASEGAMDAANILKPALARGDLRVYRRNNTQRVPKILRKRQGARAPLPASDG